VLRTVSACSQISEIPFDVVHRPVLLLGVTVEHAITGPRHHRDIAIVEIDHRSCMSEHGARVGGHQKLTVPHPEQHR